MDVEELAADMRPAGRLGDPVAGEQLIEAGITVGVDDAAEVLQMLLRVLALAVRRIEEQRRRRACAGERPLVADIGPQPSGLGLAGARRQHRHRRVVDVQHLRAHHLGGERVDQRRQRRRGRPDPTGQRRGFQADALAGEDLGLAIERQMIVVLRYDDMGEQPRPGAAAGDRVIGRRRCDHGVAGAARQLLADMPDHLEAAGHVVEGLGHILADLAQRAAAGRTGARRRDASLLRAADDRAAVGAPASALRLPPPRSPPPPRARRRRSARPGQFPASRSPTRVDRSRAPSFSDERPNSARR